MLQVKKVEVQRFYRPEDISREQAYKAGLREIYASTERSTIELTSIIGPCRVAAGTSASAQAGTGECPHVLRNSSLQRCRSSLQALLSEMLGSCWGCGCLHCRGATDEPSDASCRRGMLHLHSDIRPRRGQLQRAAWRAGRQQCFRHSSGEMMAMAFADLVSTLGSGQACYCC